MSAPIDMVLDRLGGVRKTGRGKWIARCPAHDDRSPSLGIAEGNDGTVLVQCYAGCTQYEVVDALGLRMFDLFVHDDRPGGGTSPKRRAFGPADALACLAGEIGVAVVVISDARGGQLPSDDDWSRFLVAASRIERAALEVLR